MKKSCFPRCAWLFAMFCAALLVVSCGKKAADPAAAGPAQDRVQPVEVMTVQTRSLQETVGLVGTIAANESASLRAEIAGTITEILFEEGKAVKRGDPLLRLDTRELAAQLAEAAAGFRLAEQNLTRNRTLLADSAVSQLEVDAAASEHARLRAQMDQLETRIAKSTLTAPFDGMAGARSVSVGDYVTSQDAITTIDDLSRIKVEMELPERYAAQLQPGGRFTLRAATTSPEEPVQGEVYFLSPRIDPHTRSTRVKGYVTNPPPFLKPGMFAHITLVLHVVENALVVPETALLSSPRGTVVVMPKEKDGAMVAAFVPVRTGLRIPGWVQITPVGPPVHPGDAVVSAGVGGLILFPDMKLRPVDPVVKPDWPVDTDRVIK